MWITPEAPSSRPAGAPNATRVPPAGTDPECDWCGRALRRETAVQRGSREGDETDETEVVQLCAECEFGAD